MVLPLIQFIPELNLNLDPETGILGAGGGDLIILSMDEINAEIAKFAADFDDKKMIADADRLYGLDT